MARFNERTGVTSEAMRHFAEMLRKLASTHDDLAKAMDDAGLPAIDAKNMKTGAQGLVNLSKFLGAVVEAYCENLSAVGTQELSGAAAEIERLTKRTKGSLAADKKPKSLSDVAKRAAKHAEQDPPDNHGGQMKRAGQGGSKS